MKNQFAKHSQVCENKTDTKTLVNFLRSLKHSVDQDQVEGTGQKGPSLHIEVVVGVKRVVAGILR